jgi:hypothetical protein
MMQGEKLKEDNTHQNDDLNEIPADERKLDRVQLSNRLISHFN